MKNILTIILIVSTIFAQAQKIVEGKIVDKQSNPIFAANVYLKSDTQNGAASDFDGNFKLSYTSSNEIIIASFVGYKTKEISLENIDLSQKLIIELESNSKSINEIIIKAQDPISEKFAVTKINKIDIVFNPVAQADALKAITIMPASTTVDESANPSLRGSSPDRSRVMLNGVPVYTPVRSSQLDNQGFFSIFNTELIHKQYVYASNPPLTYGNISAGLVDIQTLQNLKQNSQSLTLGLGAIGCLVSQKIKADKSFVQAYANLQKSNAFIGIQKDKLPHLKGFNTQDAGINYHNKLSKKLDFNSFSYFVNEDFKVDFPMLNYNGESNADKRRFYTVNNLKYYSSKGVISFNSGYNYSNQHFRYGNIVSNNKIRQVYLSLNYQKEILENIDFQVGASYDLHSNNFNDSIPKVYFAIEPDAINYKISKKVDNHIVESCIYANCQINRYLSLSTGLRADIPIDNQKQYLNYQVSIKYNVNKKHSLLLSGGNYSSYSIPNYYSKEYVLLQSKQIALDYSYSLKNIRIKAAGYYKKETGRQSINSYISIDNLETVGFEFYTAYRLSDHFKVTASNAFIDQHLNVGNKKFTGSYDFNYLLKLSLQFINFKWFVASVSYISRPGKHYTPLIDLIQRSNFPKTIPVFDTDINSSQYSAYNKLDFTINRYTLVGKGALIPFLSITNILNIQNTRNFYYNTDYTQKFTDVYGKRIFYFGVIWQM